MEHTSFVERLMDFGLTRQEAGIYECLLREGKTTGYEVAKQLGISRSNAYNSLASMTEKGAAYLVEEGTTKKYVPVVLDEPYPAYGREQEVAVQAQTAGEGACRRIYYDRRFGKCAG